jgi:L-threonylcarbamoyladenylate synthase
MHRVTLDPNYPAAEVLSRAAAILRDGGLVAFPTDTLYGLGADPRLSVAVEAVLRVKGRVPTRGLPLVAADLEQVDAIGKLSPLGARLASGFWPGPLTLLIEARGGVLKSVHGGSGLVAVRVPDHAVARGLAQALGHPVISTSANRSGEREASTPDEVVVALGEAVDLLLDAGAAPGGSASTIVDATGRMPRLVRVGAVDWARVLESVT